MSRDSPTPNSEPTDSQGRPIAPDVAHELQTAYLRIKPAAMALRMWRRLLSEGDRELLGGDVEEAYQRHGTVGMWMEAWDVSFERATIEVARGLNLMSEETAGWLLQELGEEDTTAPPSHPVWHPDRGELRLGNRLIRSVRMTRNPTNVRLIIEAFEAAGWPARIENPLSYGEDELYETLRNLNRDLKLIQFRAQEDGEAVVWVRR